jgi:hypothetical protein
LAPDAARCGRVCDIGSVLDSIFVRVVVEGLELEPGTEGPTWPGGQEWHGDRPLYGAALRLPLGLVFVGELRAHRSRELDQVRERGWRHTLSALRADAVGNRALSLQAPAATQAARPEGCAVRPLDDDTLHGQQLLAAAAPTTDLAEYLGHHDPAFTLRVYSHLMPGSHDRARRAIDAGMFRLRAVADGTVTEQGVRGDYFRSCLAMTTRWIWLVPS